MCVLRVFVGLLLCLLAISCGGGKEELTGGFPVANLTDEEALRQMDEQGKALAENEEYDALYGFFSPEYRSACSFDRIVRAGRFGNEMDKILKSHPRDGEIVSIEIQGERAVITSLDYSPARDELDEETDEAVKIEGRWFFEPDTESLEACQSELFGSDSSTDASIALFRFMLFVPGAQNEPGGMQDLVQRSFSQRFQQECPFDRFTTSQPRVLEQLRGLFDDPFAWEYDSSNDQVSIFLGRERVADLISEPDGWKIDALAGLVAC